MSMKKFLFPVFACVLLFGSWASVSAFRDINTQSPLFPAIEFLIEQDLFEEGTFFKPHAEVTADLFWPLVLKDAGFDIQSATFETPLPANVLEDDPLAQYIREGIRRGFIDETQPFVRDTIISRSDAIQVLVKTKGIPTSQRTSKAFLRKLGGVSAHAQYLPALEAAYTSKMITDVDTFNFKPHAPLTREVLAQWLYNYHNNGELKRATLNPRGQDQLFQTQSPYQRRRIQNNISKENKTEEQSKNTSQIFLGNVSYDTETIPRTGILQDVFSNILRKYRFPEDLTQEKKEEMIEAAITAMVKELDDKFSSYIAPAKSKEFRESLDGRFEGIGAHVEMIEDQFTITAPIKKSPAQKAGILAGDIVVAVDEEDVRGLPIMDIVNKIKGPAGTDVQLEIMRGVEKKNFVVTRASITVPTIELTFHKSVPVIAIHKFTNATKTELEKILKEEVLPKNPKGIVVDFRNDPGGLLTAAVQIGELFTHKDDLLFTIDYKDSQREFKASENGLLSSQKNIVLLQNKGTASASEIIASIIQDYNIGPIVGTSSFGKGTVQEIVNYNTEAILRVTVAKWLTPKGRWIQENEETPGIIPDVEVSDPTVDEIKKGIDRQLDTAVRLILDR